MDYKMIATWFWWAIRLKYRDHQDMHTGDVFRVDSFVPILFLEII